jgi:hypothetical protein
MPGLWGMKLAFVAAALLCTTQLAAADKSAERRTRSSAAGDAKVDDKTGLHVSTDVVSWDKPLTEAQCLEKGKAAISAALPGLTVITATHAMVGTKTDWVISVDCMQSYKANAAYIVVVNTGPKSDEYDKTKAAVSKALGGKSELVK